MTQCTEQGDSVIGERLIVEARAISKPILVHLSGKHRAQRIKLWGIPAICWIDKPFREKKGIEQRVK